MTEFDQPPAIRRARQGEASALSALALRSKARWGYPTDFLDSVRELLTFSETDLVETSVYVLDLAGAPAGVYRLIGEPPEGELADLWLDPRCIGGGWGRRMLRHALQTAAELGHRTLVIESDPHAEGFYATMGATRIGDRRSPSGRTLPLMRMSTLGPVDNPVSVHPERSGQSPRSTARTWSAASPTHPVPGRARPAT